MPDIPTVTGDTPSDGIASPLARRHKAMEAIFGTRFLNTFVSPYLVIEDHVIECPVGVRLFKKDFNYLSKQLYLEYQYRGWRDFDPAVLDRFAAIVTGKLAALDTTMQQTINRLQKRCWSKAGSRRTWTLWLHQCMSSTCRLSRRKRATTWRCCRRWTACTPSPALPICWA